MKGWMVERGFNLDGWKKHFYPKNAKMCIFLPIVFLGKVSRFWWSLSLATDEVIEVSEAPESWLNSNIINSDWLTNEKLPHCPQSCLNIFTTDCWHFWFWLLCPTSSNLEKTRTSFGITRKDFYFRKLMTNQRGERSLWPIRGETRGQSTHLKWLSGGIWWKYTIGCQILSPFEHKIVKKRGVLG